MKTVLHVFESWGPGGAETVFVQLVTRLSAREFKNLAVISHSGWVEDSLLAAGVTPLRAPMSGLAPTPVDLRLHRRLVQLVRDHHVDLIHSHTLGISTYACLAGLWTRTPVVCTLHGDVDLGRTDRRRGVKLRVLRWGASKVVLVSRYLQEQVVRETPIRREQTAVVHNGIDCDPFSGGPDRTFRDALGVPPDAFLVGAVGNVRVAKAYDTLLRAAAVAARRDARLRFVVVGQTKGDLIEPLMHLSRELGMNEVVTFAGFRDDIVPVLRSFDAFLLSSRSEGFSIATVQAMAAGLPVIATRSGGPEEIITDGVDGVFVPPDDPEAMAGAVVRIAADADLRARIGSAARATARARFSLAQMLESYEGIYREVLR